MAGPVLGARNEIERPALLPADGLTYRALEPRLPARQRLRWLALDPGGHQSQPYEQLAAEYVSAGQAAQARTILYTRERMQRLSYLPIAAGWVLVTTLAAAAARVLRRS